MLKFTPNPRATGNLSLTANARARMSSVIAIDWNHVTDKPDFSSIASLTGTGILSRIAIDGTWALRTLVAPAAGLTITNPAGIAGDETFALANDLSALEGLASTGIAARTATDTWAQRSIVGTANEITLTNGDGVAGNPTASLPSVLVFTGKSVTGGTFNSPALVTPALGTPASVTLTNATGLPISTGLSGAGSGVLAALAINVGSAGSPVTNGGALGTPSSGSLANATGLPISTGLTGVGTGVITALGVNVGSAGAFVTFNGALGTPSSGVATNLTGTAASLTAGHVTTNANMTGDVTSVGNATTLAAGNAGNLNSGTLLAARMPALTGDVTTTAGAVATTIGANKVTNAMRAQMAAYTIKGNNSGSTANEADIDVTALTLKASPAAADIVLIQDSAASNAFKKTTVSALATAGSVSSIAGNTGAFTLSTGITNSTNDIRLDRGQLPGETSTGSASAGNMGEYVSASRASASAINLTTGTDANVTASPLSLTAGDWDVSGVVGYSPSGSTVVTIIISGISTTSNSLPGADSGQQSGISYGTAGATGGSSTYNVIPTTRISVSATTSVYLVARASFTTSNLAVWGNIRARRVR